MNYYDDPHDMEVMVAVLRRALDVMANWPGHRDIGPLLVPPALAAEHGHVTGDTPSDDLLEDLAASLLLHRLPPDDHVPDGKRRRSRACE